MKVASVKNGGAIENFPENNCCGCGKSNVKFYQLPNREPEVCTHKKVNSVSRHVVDLCSLVRTRIECQSGSYTEHCNWNPAFTGVSFDTNDVNTTSTWNQHKGARFIA